MSEIYCIVSLLIIRHVFVEGRNDLQVGLYVVSPYEVLVTPQEKLRKILMKAILGTECMYERKIINIRNYAFKKAGFA